MTLLVMASFSAGTTDGAGNLLFQRVVPPYERSEMTTVFAHLHEVTQVGPAAVSSVLPTFFNLSSVFVAEASRRLSPRRHSHSIFTQES
jgi:hypothetical protein